MAVLTIRQFKENYKQWLGVSFDTFNHHKDSDGLDDLKQIVIETDYESETVADIATAISEDEQVVIDHISFIKQIKACIASAVDEMKIYETIDDESPAPGLQLLCIKIAKYHFYGDLRPKDDIWKSTIASDYRAAIKTLEKRNKGELAPAKVKKNHASKSSFTSSTRRY